MLRITFWQRFRVALVPPALLWAFVLWGQTLPEAGHYSNHERAFAFYMLTWVTIIWLGLASIYCSLVQAQFNASMRNFRRLQDKFERGDYDDDRRI